jgi:hypothetical protein
MRYLYGIHPDRDYSGELTVHMSQILFRTLAICGIIALIGLMVCASPAGASQSVSATLGEDIPLSGSAAGLDTVYLFVTGVNLDSNGVRLDDLRRAVRTGVSSSFTQVDVINNHWTYTWETSNVADMLDAGHYTIFVVDRPAGKNDLSGTEYSIISVSFTRSGFIQPNTYISNPGEIKIITVPEGATVIMNGNYMGVTPLSLKDLNPGTYSIELAREGYITVYDTISIDPGYNSNYQKTLLPEPVPTATATPTAQPPATTSSPVSLAALCAGITIGSIIFARRGH